MSLFVFETRVTRRRSRSHTAAIDARIAADSACAYRISSSASSFAVAARVRGALPSKPNRATSSFACCSASVPVKTPRTMRESASVCFCQGFIRRVRSGTRMPGPRIACALREAVACAGSQFRTMRVTALSAAIPTTAASRPPRVGSKCNDASLAAAMASCSSVMTRQALSCSTACPTRASIVSISRRCWLRMSSRCTSVA